LREICHDLCFGWCPLGRCLILSAYSGAPQQAAQGSFSGWAALRAGNVPVAVNDNVDGINRCLIQSR
jgi:hypothetical protein